MRIPNREAMDKGSNAGTGYIVIEEGDNIIRIVSDIFGVKEHRVTIEKKVHNIVCPYEQARWKAEVEGDQSKDFPNCPLCEKGDKVKKQFLALAIKRSFDDDGKLVLDKFECGILKKGPWVFEPIADYKDDKNWGDVRDYDLNIKATGKDLDRTYSVVPTPKDKCEPLTEDEKAMVTDMESNINLEEMTTPRSYEDINKLLTGQEPDIPF